jgi:hypothetical protein
MMLFNDQKEMKLREFCFQQYEEETFDTGWHTKPENINTTIYFLDIHHPGFI